jgi:hypothetical protein
MAIRSTVIKMNWADMAMHGLRTVLLPDREPGGLEPGKGNCGLVDVVFSLSVLVPRQGPGTYLLMVTGLL